jgi:hypothetical protein
LIRGIHHLRRLSPFLPLSVRRNRTIYDSAIRLLSGMPGNS